MKRAQEDVYKELEEELLIVVAYTVINPRAMMVHTCNTTFTD